MSAIGSAGASCAPVPGRPHAAEHLSRARAGRAPPLPRSGSAERPRGVRMASAPRPASAPRRVPPAPPWRYAPPDFTTRSHFLTASATAWPRSAVPFFSSLRSAS